MTGSNISELRGPQLSWQSPTGRRRQPSLTKQAKPGIDGELLDVGVGKPRNPSGTRRTLTQPLALQSTALRVALRSSGGNSVSYTMLFELLTLAIHLFKNTLAGQLGFAATLTEPNPRVFSE
jgi:hypothetical protein